MTFFARLQNLNLRVFGLKFWGSMMTLMDKLWKWFRLPLPCPLDLQALKEVSGETNWLRNENWKFWKIAVHWPLDKVRRSGGISCYFSENYFSGCLLAHWELKFWPAKGVVCSIQVSEFLFCFQLLKPESTSIKKCVKTKKNDDFMSFLCRFSHFEL